MFHNIVLKYVLCEVLPGNAIMAYVGLCLYIRSFLNLAVE